MYHEKRKSSVADPDCSHQRESRCSADGTESGSCVVSTRTKLGVYEKAVLEVMESRRSLKKQSQDGQEPRNSWGLTTQKILDDFMATKRKALHLFLSPVSTAIIYLLLKVDSLCQV